MEESEAAERFLARHVRADKSCDVQCMLLWTEWVRYHMREKKKRVFPEKIKLPEFNELIHTKFGPALAHDSYRGPLYVGIRFLKQPGEIPGKKTPTIAPDLPARRSGPG